MNTDGSDVLLTLLAPGTLEESLLDALLALPDCAHGFRSWPVEGHGEGVPLELAREAVRGRGHCVAFQSVLSAQAAERVLAAVRDALPNADLHYWVVPVLAHGRLR